MDRMCGKQRELHKGAGMEFDRVWKIKKDLSMDQMRMEELKCDAYSIGARDLSGKPKRPGFSIDGGRTARCATEIADLEEIILDRKIELVQELNHCRSHRIVLHDLWEKKIAAHYCQ